MNQPTHHFLNRAAKMLGTYPEALRVIVERNNFDHLMVDGKMILPLATIALCKPIVKANKERPRITRATA